MSIACNICGSYLCLGRTASRAGLRSCPGGSAERPIDERTGQPDTRIFRYERRNPMSPDPRTVKCPDVTMTPSGRVFVWSPRTSYWQTERLLSAFAMDPEVDSSEADVLIIEDNHRRIGDKIPSIFA